MEHNCDAEKSSVKQFLVSSYDRVLSPKVRASVTAAVSAAAASEDAATIGNQLKNSLPRHIYIIIYKQHCQKEHAIVVKTGFKPHSSHHAQIPSKIYAHLQFIGC